MIKYFLATSRDTESVKDILKKIDSTFPVPLSKKCNIDVLAEKFINKGHVIMAFDGTHPIGLIAFYANDTVNKTAYASVIGIIKNYQHQGIGKELLNKCISICKEKGMTSCFLHTHKTNFPAISMYERLGFVANNDPNIPDDLKFVKTL